MVKRTISAVLLILVFTVGVWRSAHAQRGPVTYEHPESPPTMQELLKWKELLTYEVKYSLFKLGEVQTEVIRDTTYQGEHLWWLRSKIISDPSVPFVGREENHYNTLFVATDSLPHTRLYWRDNVDEDEYNAERYDFDYEAGKVYLSRAGEPEDTLDLEGPSTSGQLILLYGRLFAGSVQPYQLPVYIEGEKGLIDVKNTRKSEMREYEAFEHPIKTYYSEGDANIDGPFGFSGEFKAWYMADDLRVPLETHAKVWLGNVKVRLIDYQKVKRKP
ncbi:DUF3108 domain-containing protein [Fodinibius salsisoli]|uniref:DUF3108 domain-containing protein n=1 Tax=Fodinibius salsisoli TaxID=2820877 RepID=A0ABT3PIS0_9BACT|nr:DUF3108 domain-containing protein [Fodinibius salsisoli]MCW9705826.1 DUF3108 domain-containing protein [Fodinibius salsisoli]